MNFSKIGTKKDINSGKAVFDFQFYKLVQTFFGLVYMRQFGTERATLADEVPALEPRVHGGAGLEQQRHDRGRLGVRER